MPGPDLSKGKPTEQTTMIVCQCGSVGFVEEKKTRTAVVFRCAKCKERTSVQGRAAIARVPFDEVTHAVKNVLIPETVSKQKPVPVAEVEAEHLVHFDPRRICPSDIDTRSDLDENQIELLKEMSEEQMDTLKRFLNKREPWRFSSLVKHKAFITKAMDGVRLLNHGSPGFAEQTWQGEALYFMALDVFAGFPPEVIACLDAIDAASDQLADEARAKGKTWSRRKDTKVRNDTRDALAKKFNFGIYKDTEYTPPADPVVQEALDFEEQRRDEREDKAEQNFIVDNGHLARALAAVREELELDGKMLIGGPTLLQDFLRLSEEKGGYVLRVDGDKRTKTEAGQPVLRYVWLAYEDQEDPFDFLVAYLDEIDGILPDAELEVVELLPANFDEIDQWEQPLIADKREKIQ